MRIIAKINFYEKEFGGVVFGIKYKEKRKIFYRSIPLAKFREYEDRLEFLTYCYSILKQEDLLMFVKNKIVQDILVNNKVEIKEIKINNLLKDISKMPKGKFEFDIDINAHS